METSLCDDGALPRKRGRAPSPHNIKHVAHTGLCYCKSDSKQYVSDLNYIRLQPWLKIISGAPSLETTGLEIPRLETAKPATETAEPTESAPPAVHAVKNRASPFCAAP